MSTPTIPKQPNRFENPFLNANRNSLARAVANRGFGTQFAGKPPQGARKANKPSQQAKPTISSQGQGNVATDVTPASNRGVI